MSKIRKENPLARPAIKMSYENNAVIDYHAKFISSERQAKEERIRCNIERKNNESNIMDDGKVYKGTGATSLVFFSD